ncbi:hypothetical protein [Marinobacter sp.]|uniref:hypothetical protein n=1 Tax=Marinobacter sp. TaxID=50741 RepID=UPI00262BAAE1|nr:hypothetical protein [Marinobacter sp.]
MTSSVKLQEAFPVGMVVTNGKPVLGARAGSLGVVYEHYSIGSGHFGVGILFVNGGYDGFSEDCTDICEINPVRFEASVSDYEFNGVDDLMERYRKGYFDKAFKPLTTNGQ